MDLSRGNRDELNTAEAANIMESFCDLRSEPFQHFWTQLVFNSAFRQVSAGKRLSTIICKIEINLTIRLIEAGTITGQYYGTN